MKRDVVCTEERRDQAKPDLREAAAERFTRDDRPRPLQLLANRAKVRLGELMEDKIPDDDRVICPEFEREDIRLMPRLACGPVEWPRPQIETVHFDPKMGESQPQLAGTRAEFKHTIIGLDQTLERLRDPPMIAHSAIGESQIAPIMQGGRIVGRQAVQYLGLDRTFHDVLGKAGYAG